MVGASGTMPLEHDAAVHRTYLDVGARHVLAQLGAQIVDVGRHVDFDDAQDFLVFADDGKAGRADFLANDIDRVIRERHDIRDLGLGDEGRGIRPVDIHDLGLLDHDGEAFDDAAVRRAGFGGRTGLHLAAVGIGHGRIKSGKREQCRSEHCGPHQARVQR